MKNVILITFSISILMLWSCGGGGKSRVEQIKEQSKIKKADPYESWQTNHGIGPIKAFDLSGEVDQELAVKGEEVFKSKCTACHKVDKKFIGPSPKDILSRRTPAWIMNMILNPDGMLKEDPIAKALLKEYNNAIMLNQNLTEDEARDIAEYLRTL